MTAAEEQPFDPANAHVLHELGLALDRDAHGVHGTATVVPELCTPGTPYIRRSVLATWADQMCGFIVVEVLEPRVPVTLSLGVQVPVLRDIERVNATARLVKTGGSVTVVGIEFTDERGGRIGLGTASFMPVPDPTMTMPVTHLELARTLPRAPGGPLLQPFADRVGCTRVGAGTAILPRSEDGLNSSNTVNGGLIALAAEEAVLSASPGAVLTALSLSYLRPIRLGPAVARADVQDGVASVEVRDEGADNRLAVLATATVTDGA